MKSKQEQMIGLMREILQDEYVELTVRSYDLTENLETETCQIRCRIGTANGSELSVEGAGVGPIDALFSGLRSHLADDYPSLTQISFTQLTIEALLSPDSRSGASSEALVRATVGVSNSEGQEFVFQTEAPSISRAGIEATILAAAYFVNSEKTYLRLLEILNHYRDEGRTDLVEKYTELMTRVVQNTSYSEIAAREDD